MKLSVHERLLLLNLLPATGDITSIKLLRKAKEDLSFNEKENKDLGFVQDGEILRWNSEKGNVEKDVTIGDIITELIKTELKKMNEEKKLTDQHISIYEKFIG